MSENGVNAVAGAVYDAGNWSCYTTTPADSLVLFEAARDRGGIAHSSAHDGFHMLLNYADVRAAMLDHATFSSQPQVLRPMLPRPPIPALDMDPPRHRAWRAIFNRAVTPAIARQMEPFIRADITRHIDNFISRGHCDIVAELCEPVPAETICYLVGIDEALVSPIREAAIRMFAAQGDPELFATRQAEFAAVTVPLVHERRARPREDYLSQLASVEVEGRALTDDDYVVLLSAILGAGHHSTTSAMASLIRYVFTTPGLRETLLADQTKIGAAVEESLRLSPSFYGFFRRTTATAQVAGVEIAPRQDVYLGWAAANRDPLAFPQPDEFRLNRPTAHLSFGMGIHTCPGAPLARIELRVMLEELLKRLPELQIAATTITYAFGGGDYAYIESLPIVFTGREPVSKSA